MTPLDVIKTRLQTQHKTLLSDKCFVYCNGLMDHLCPCYPATNGGTAAGANLSSTTASVASTFHSALPSHTVGGPTIRPPASSSGSNGGGISARGTAAAQHYTGTLDALHKISRNEGIRTLWSGLGPTLVLAIPATVIYFVFYEQLRVRMKDEYMRRNPHLHSADQTPFYVPLLAGMTARVTSVTVVNPLELVRTKMQSQRMSYFGEFGHLLSGFDNIL